MVNGRAAEPTHDHLQRHLLLDGEVIASVALVAVYRQIAKLTWLVEFDEQFQLNSVVMVPNRLELCGTCR